MDSPEIKNNFLILIFLFLFIFSCSTKQCDPNQRNQNSTTAENLNNLKLLNTDRNQAAMKTIKIYKLDGSVQCEPQSGKQIQEIQSELEGIAIYSSKKSHDGMMRTQVCGQLTGQCFVFEIAENDLEKAKNKGFKIWKND